MLKCKNNVALHFLFAQTLPNRITLRTMLANSNTLNYPRDLAYIQYKYISIFSSKRLPIYYILYKYIMTSIHDDDTCIVL